MGEWNVPPFPKAQSLHINAGLCLNSQGTFWGELSEPGHRSFPETLVGLEAPRGA